MCLFRVYKRSRSDFVQINDHSTLNSLEMKKGMLFPFLKSVKIILLLFGVTKTKIVSNKFPLNNYPLYLSVTHKY